MMKVVKLIILVVQVLVLLFMLQMRNGEGYDYNITYDNRSMIINGERKLLISASIHYPRSVPATWLGLIQLAKEGGANMIESYVFWDGHEPSPDNYYFEGRYDLVKFVKTVQHAGMYMMLRIGPFVAAEWNYGGVPVWLHYVPGTVFRTDNEPWKYYMQKFTTYIVNLLKQEKLFGSQGGPIILAQIENEYGDYELGYGDAGKRYLQWCVRMALSQDIGVPWTMCQQWDTPDPVINTCNSFYCHDFTPLSEKSPKIWAEDWAGWMTGFGSTIPHRPAEDNAYAVALFFQKGGSVHNYYMYHGGTNFGRTAGGLITPSYDYDAPIDEYGLARLPKWGHLKELHAAIMLCEKPLLNGERTNLSLGPLLEADVYTETSGACAAFISNSDNKTDRIVQFRNMTYSLPAWSVSILPDCKNVVFNSAQVGSQSSVVEMVPEKLKSSDVNTLQWEVFVENPGIWGEPDFNITGFVDHINTTKDTTDYLWLTTSLFLDSNEIFLENNSSQELWVKSKGHALHVFVNWEFQGSLHGVDYTDKVPISLKAGNNEIALLSMTVGMKSAGVLYEWVGAGLTSVEIKELKNGTLDLSNFTWFYKIGVQGEHLNLYKESSNWKPITGEPPKQQPLTWYKTVVDAPPGNEPIGLDMIHMWKGSAWLNGEHLGRYWLMNSSKYDKCVDHCDYRGVFSARKCSTGCGEPTQRWYHIPRSWFKPSGNVLVIFEERGGDPTQIRFSKRKVSSICTVVSEDHPSISVESRTSATAKLSCPGTGTGSATISSIKFASFGDPSGACGNFTRGICHDPDSVSAVEKMCLNRSECEIKLTDENFSHASCNSTVRRLAVEAVCDMSEPPRSTVISMK